MIVYTMSEAELKREVLLDMCNAFRWEDRNSNKFRRLVLKATRFPVYFAYQYTSPRKNKWIISLEARSKKETKDDCRISYVVTYESPHGTYAVLVSWVNNEPQLIMYPPHFFSRFRDRAGVNEISTVRLMVRFFRHNGSYVYDKQTKQIAEDKYCVEVYGSTLEGVCLGIFSTEGNILFRTFVTYEMLKGEQVERFTENERIRKEIHGA